MVNKPKMNDFILLCGLGKVGFSILELLRSLGERVVVVTTQLQPDWARRAETMADKLILGDARLEHVLIDAGIDRARAVIIVTNDDLVNLEIALDAQRLAPGIAVVVRLYDQELAKRVQRDIQVRAVLNAAALSAPAFVAAALGDEILRAFDVEDNFINILSLRAQDEASGLGQTLHSLATRLNVIPLAISRGDAGHQTVPSLDEVLEPGDEVIVAASKQTLNVLQHSERAPFSFSHSHDHDGHRTNPNQWVRPHLSLYSLAKRAWDNASGTLKAGFLALNSLVLVSMAVFHYGMKLSWLNAFYFTITIMTTVGFGDLHLIDQPWGIKLFGCFMMVAGVAMLVIFFTIITDYLVKQRVEQFIGPKSTTLRDHIIVVGLGNVGYRVAMRLHELGEPVLAVERDEDSRYISQLEPDIPVMIGDASHRALLEQAGVGRARALVAATADDLENLRIAQRAEAMNSNVRTVVRLFQSALAEKLGSSILGINRPLNPSQAAAATFVACALVPDVLQGFTLGNRLLILRWLDADRLGPCVGRTVLDLREKGGFIILLRRRSKEDRLRHAENTDVIEPGDRLVVLEEYRPGDRLTASCEVQVMAKATRQ